MYGCIAGIFQRYSHTAFNIVEEQKRINSIRFSIKNNELAYDSCESEKDLSYRKSLSSGKIVR